MGGDGVGGSGQRAVGASRAVDRTVFWNLVVHFREHCLPITFLLADASMGEDGLPDFFIFFPAQRQRYSLCVRPVEKSFQGEFVDTSTHPSRPGLVAQLQQAAQFACFVCGGVWFVVCGSVGTHSRR